jgi:prephenate dehydratase
MEELVAYQGEPGANSDEAARLLFPDSQTLGLSTFAAVFAAVVQKVAQIAVLPVENSRAGVVQEVSDQLWDHPELAVVGEQVMPIRHHLLSPGGQRVERALSHPQALAQCATWLREHGIVAVAHPDTAGAARQVAESRVPGDGAIASLAAARLYGLEVVAEDIADEPSNQTRFVVVTDRARASRPAAGHAKASMGLIAPHRPGGLVQVLEVFADLNLNLTRLDARPIPDQPFHYRFYLDAELDEAGQLDELLRRLAVVSQELRLFGVYRPPGSAGAPSERTAP